MPLSGFFQFAAETGERAPPLTREPPDAVSSEPGGAERGASDCERRRAMTAFDYYSRHGKRRPRHGKRRRPQVSGNGNGFVLRFYVLPSGSLLREFRNKKIRFCFRGICLNLCRLTHRDRVIRSLPLNPRAIALGHKDFLVSAFSW